MPATCISSPASAPLQTSLLPFFNSLPRLNLLIFSSLCAPALAKHCPHPFSSISLPSCGDHAHQKLLPGSTTLLLAVPESCCPGQEKSLLVQSVLLLTDTPANKPAPSQAAQPLWEQQTRGVYQFSVPENRQPLLPQPATEKKKA